MKDPLFIAQPQPHRHGPPQVFHMARVLQCPNTIIFYLAKKNKSYYLYMVFIHGSFFPGGPQAVHFVPHHDDLSTLDELMCDLVDAHGLARLFIIVCPVLQHKIKCVT